MQCSGGPCPTAHHTLSVAGLPGCPPEASHPAKRAGASRREPGSMSKCWGTRRIPSPGTQSPIYKGESRLSGLEARGPEDDSAILCLPQTPPRQKWAPGLGWLVASGAALHSLSHGEGQLKVLPPLRGAQGAVVKGVGEE